MSDSAAVVGIEPTILGELSGTGMFSIGYS